MGARKRYRELATLRTERTPSPSCMNIMHRRAIRASLSMEPLIVAAFNTALVRSAATRLARFIPTHSRSLRFAMLDRVLCRTRIDERLREVQIHIFL